MSDFTKSEPIIRVVRKKKGHGGHHGGAWKVAYADFVTAMMAFFLVMWIVGLDKPTRVAIASYFRDPSGFNKMTSGGKSPLSQGISDAMDRKQNAPLIPTDGGAQKQVEIAMQTQFKSVAEAIIKKMEKTPEFKNLKESVQVHLTTEGLRIELMEKTSSLFFDTGSARLKPRTVALLGTIAHELHQLDNPIVIEGHTDSRPYDGGNGYSNWELSADRANAARRAMEGNGLRTNQVLAVHGYADRKLFKPEDPFHFSNRRVSILVAYHKTGQ